MQAAQRAPRKEAPPNVSVDVALRCEVLGPLVMSGSGGPIALPRGRAAALVCWLALRQGQAVAPRALAELLWPSVLEGAQGPGDHLGALGALASRVRAALGGPYPAGQGLALDKAGYRLVLEPGALDAAAFEHLVSDGLRRGTSERDGSAAESLSAALALWRGEPYAELALHPLALVEVTRLRLLHMAATEELNGIRLAGPVDYQLVADLEAMTWRHPERERLWRQLALALYRSGRQVEALRVFARCRRAMGGVAEVLAPESVRLERAIARQDPTLEDGELTD